MKSDPAKEESPSTVKKRSPDLAKFWKAVEDDPKDFTGWTYLLQFVDTTGDIDDGREAYDAFLFRYPYCYGYWKKFADLEKRKGNYSIFINMCPINGEGENFMIARSNNGYDLQRICEQEKWRILRL